MSRASGNNLTINGKKMHKYKIDKQSKAYKEGMEWTKRQYACIANNPYKVRTQQHKDWRAGYEKAENDRKEKE